MARISAEDIHRPPFVVQQPHFPHPHGSLHPYEPNAIGNEQHAFGDEDHDASATGSGRHSSDGDEAVFDISPHHSSPRTSHHSDDDDDDISVLLPESKYEHALPDRQLSSSPYTPHKARSPFRNPSSVRALQMDTTPPYLTSSHSHQRYKFSTPSRSGTPRSTRSYHSVVRPSSKSPSKKVKREYPLVLLHVTLLPIPLSYSLPVMQSVLPSYILENWKLLQEKATDTVLERGILIPHPRDDYDLLEERLLESLELKVPRILKCGHFHHHTADGPEFTESDHVHDVDSDDDVDICDDCGRRVRDGRFGSGTGSRRWNIKVYAANGLMRSGAWGAAWREMERIDVEIVPWMDEDMKRELEVRRAEEEEVREIPEPVQQEVLHERPLEATSMDEARMREIYGESPQPYIDGLQDEEPCWDESRASPHPDSRYQRQPPSEAIPLNVLLRNYVYLAAHDSRNIAIFLLSLLVLFLALWKPRTASDLALSQASRHQFLDTTSIPSIVEFTSPDPTGAGFSTHISSMAPATLSQKSVPPLERQTATAAVVHEPQPQLLHKSPPPPPPPPPEVHPTTAVLSDSLG